MHFKSWASRTTPALIVAPIAALLAAIGLGSTDRSPASASDGPQAQTGPALVELFTSQGCSSCPPADLLAEVLDREGEVVVVSRPVTYWDRLGWKDTLARPQNTALQQSYARRGLGGYNGVYTPQMVIDGSFGVVGSSEAEVRAAIAKRAIQPAAIRTNRLPNGDVRVGLGGKLLRSARQGASRGAQLMLLAIDSHQQVGIGGGENGGRRISYTNVLRGETVLVRWNGGKASVTIDRAGLMRAQADRYALVLQEAGGGPVLASAWIS